MWHDNETTTDLIDFRHLVHAAMLLVRDKKIHPATVGIYGDWGSGKSSLMRMIESDLDSDEKTLIVRFNAWIFEGYEDAKSTLLNTIIDDIVAKKKITAKGKVILKRLLKQVNWMKLAKAGIKHGIAFASSGPAGLTASVLTDSNIKEVIDQTFDVDKHDDEVTTIRDFHLDLKKLLDDSNLETIVVFIDDLDRCLPDTALDILEAIKLFLYIPNSIFLIAADDFFVKEAVRKKFAGYKDKPDLDMGTEYLEKLIQFPIQIPTLSEQDVQLFIMNLFAGEILPRTSFEKAMAEIRSQGWQVKGDFNSAKQCFLSQDGVTDDLREMLAMAVQIGPVLAIGLSGNPRQCKRFLNTMVTRLEMAKSRGMVLRRSILAKLMLLEYFREDHYAMLYASVQNGNGVSADLDLLELMPSEAKEEKKETALQEKVGTLAAWLSDDWMKRWLEMDPPLGKEYLQGYFDNSTESKIKMSGATRRLSEPGQEILRQLLSASEAERNNGIAKLDSLDTNEARLLFSILQSRIERSEDAASIENVVDGYLGIAEIKHFIDPMLLFWKNYPVNNIPVSLLPKLMSLCEKHQVVDKLKPLVNDWSKSSNQQLKLVAQNQLKRMS